LSSDEYALDSSSPRKDLVDNWLDELRDDAEFNITSYVDCFLSENLARKYITENGIGLKGNIKAEATKWRTREANKKGKANLSFDIRKIDEDIDYLGMDELAISIEGNKASGGEQSLWLDAVSYAPVRNVVGHTGLLTGNAKSHLRLTHENIKARIKTLVSKKRSKKKPIKKKVLKKTPRRPR
jgi:hypothetical protein